MGNRVLRIGVPGTRYYIFKWNSYYFFPQIKMERSQDIDREMQISYFNVFLSYSFIPEDLKKYEYDILKELRIALDIYGEIGINSTYKYILNFEF